MSKPTKKRNKYNVLVVKELAKKYNTSAIYVRQCLRGERHSDTAEHIQQEYKKLENSLKKTINEFNNKK